MSQAVNNQYYTDSYGSQNYGVESNSEQNPYGAYQGDAYDPSLYFQDSFEGPAAGDGETTGAGSDTLDAYQSHLDEIQASLDSDPKLKELQPQVAQLKLQLQRASDPGLDDKTRQALLNQIDAKMTELDATLSNAGSVEDLEQRVSDLNDKLQSAEIPADRAGDKDALQRRLDQVRAKVDLKINADDLQKDQDEVESIETDLDSLQSDVDAKRQQALSSFEDKSNTLSQQIEGSSYLSDAQKQELKSQVDAKVTELRQGLQDGTVSEDDANAALDAIDYDAGGKARRGQLAQDFDGFSAKVPATGYAWDVTKKLAGQITDALHSGNWDQVKSLLDKLSNDGNDGYSTAQANNVVMQVMGTIYYKLANSDAGKFNAYLDLIDVDVRKKMETAVMADKGEQYSADGYNSDADKQNACVYGIPADCRDALEASIHWSQDPQRSRTRITASESASTNA